MYFHPWENVYHSVEWYWPLERLLWAGTGGIWEISTMENSSGVPSKIKTISTMWSSNPTSGYITKIIEIRVPKRYLHAHMWVHACMLSLQSCLTTCSPRDCSPPGTSVQEHWSGLPRPPPGYLPDPGIEPAAPALQGDSLLLSHQGRPSSYLLQHYSQQPRQGNKPNVHEQSMNKDNEVHTYSGISFCLKGKEILPFATWMNLEEIMLSEISQ